jgi:hypothetical protein
MVGIAKEVGAPKIESLAASLLTVLLFSVPIRAQENQAFVASMNYPATSAGLQQLLETMLLSAKNNDLQKLTELAKTTELPNCTSWLHRCMNLIKRTAGWGFFTFPGRCLWC